MSITTPDRDADTQPFIVAMVAALAADTDVTTGSGYVGVGDRISPDADVTGDDYPYLVITAPANTVPTDYGTTYFNGLFDITAIDRSGTAHNKRGGTQNVVPVAAAAVKRLVNHPLAVTGWTNVQVTTESAPRGMADVQQGAIVRRRLFTVRITAVKQ